MHEAPISLAHPTRNHTGDALAEWAHAMCTGKGSLPSQIITLPMLCFSARKFLERKRQAVWRGAIVDCHQPKGHKRDRMVTPAAGLLFPSKLSKCSHRLEMLRAAGGSPLFNVTGGYLSREQQEEFQGVIHTAGLAPSCMPTSCFEGLMSTMPVSVVKCR